MKSQLLLTKEIRDRLPRLHETESEGMQAVALVKFFTPDSNWTWYATEFDCEGTFFGLVVGFEMELGYFTLSELREIHGVLGLPVERDKYFRSTTLEQLERMHQ